MKIQGTHTFDAPRERVWRALLDPEVLARTLPGCEKLERVAENAENAENEFRGVLNVNIGPVKGQFQGTLQLSDIRPPESYHMRLDGKGPAGFMNGEGELRLSDSGSATVLAYDLDAQVGGRVAGVGQRLLESSAKSITRQGLEGLAREIAGMGEPGQPKADDTPEASGASKPSAAPTPPPPRQPSQAELAARVASDVFRDLVPPEQRPWVIGGAVLALGAIVLLVVRSFRK
ncbi:MAG TPA: carbon monoxide dehydrogenase subunit G [Thermoanaerobaculia bacterium]|nr:carbon monoxide dehydrogenase subunit G [Thermoanaerobaculia bacterium]